MKTLSINGRRVSIQFRMGNLGRAFAFADGCKRAMFVVMGDDGMFWIVGGADAQRLERAGYELAVR
jgi:hypothetical protein